MSSAILFIPVYAALGGIVWLLVNIFRRGIPTTITYDIDPKLTETIEQIAKATAHHVDVAATVEMVRQIENDPQAIQRLKNYPLAVQRAAIAHYADQLGIALQKAQKRQQTYYSQGHDYYAGKEQDTIDEIRAKLNALVAASKTT